MHPLQGLNLLLSLACGGCQYASFSQSPSEISVSPGQTVALECAVANVTADKVNVNWIWQSPGQKPEGVLLFKMDLSIYRAPGIPERYVPSQRRLQQEVPAHHPQRPGRRRLHLFLLCLLWFSWSPDVGRGDPRSCAEEQSAPAPNPAVPSSPGGNCHRLHHPDLPSERLLPRLHRRAVEARLPDPGPGGENGAGGTGRGQNLLGEQLPDGAGQRVGLGCQLQLCGQARIAGIHAGGEHQCQGLQKAV
ncbi:unnamed protein product, partial [Lepidochelys kempii]